MNERTRLAQNLTGAVLARLQEAEGEWVPYADLLALAPEGRIACIPELEHEEPFGADYAHGGAYDAGPSGEPDGRMLEDCLNAVRRQLGSTPLRLAEGYPPAPGGTPRKRAFRLVDAADVEPVGLAEIAERLGVERATTDKWRQRGVLPEHWWTVGGRPAWPWHVIRQWAQETGRMPRKGESR